MIILLIFASMIRDKDIKICPCKFMSFNNMAVKIAIVMIQTFRDTDTRTNNNHTTNQALGPAKVCWKHTTSIQKTVAVYMPNTYMATYR